MSGCQGLKRFVSAPSANQRTLIDPKKQCAKCGEAKFLDKFCRSKYTKDGLNRKCKKCLYAERKQYLKNNPDKAKKFNGRWDKANPEHARARSKAWRESNKKRFSETVKKWRKENSERNKELQKKWHTENPHKIAEYAKKRRADPIKNIGLRIGGYMRQCLRENKAGRSWESLVGYTVKDLKNHIEKQFKPGMSWENMSLWHIDHIIPLNYFNYQTPEDDDFKKAWALENLQPLWAKENCTKRDRLDWEGNGK